MASHHFLAGSSIFSTLAALLMIARDGGATHAYLAGEAAQRGSLWSGPESICLLLFPTESNSSIHYCIVFELLKIESISNIMYSVFESFEDNAA